MGEINETAANDIVAVVILIVKQTCKASVLQVLQFSLTPRVKTRQLKMHCRGDITLTGPAKVLRLAPRVLMRNILTLRRPVAEPTPTYGLAALSYTHTQNKTVWLHHMACTKSKYTFHLIMTI